MSMSERWEARKCDNPIYLRNLVESLEAAKDRKDIERIILYATELERYKVLCGYTPAIELLEKSMRRISEELELTENPTIERALNTTPKKICCKCCEPEEPAHQEGFLAQLEASRGGQDTEHTEPNPTSNSEFQRMLDESCKSKPSYMAIPKTATRVTGMLREIDESQFPEKCNPELCPKDFSRHCRANTEAHRGEPCIYLTQKNR